MRSGPVLPQAFIDAMNDDLGTPAAVAVIHDSVREGNRLLGEGPSPELGRKFGEVMAMLDVLGLSPADPAWTTDSAPENLKKAAIAIFGDNDEATRWHEKLRDKLLLDDRAVENTIRTIRRCRDRTSTGGDRRNVVDNAIKYFRFHRDRMRYTDFIARGLPIGSGPVESAAKNIVQARLKRSGMRWSRDGGQHVLDLRTFLKSDRWGPMWSTITKAA